MKTMYEFFKWKLLTVFIVFLLTGGVGAVADENKTSSRISLNEILEDVIKTSPEILEAQENYRSVVEERSIATSGYRPTIGAEASTGPEVTDGVDTGYIREELWASTATLYARQNLFNGGKTASFVEETDARILAAAYEVITVANRVFLETSEAYINVLKTRELLEFSKENVMTQEKILGQVKEKTTAGFTRLSDLSNSKARLSLAKGNYISTQQDLSQAIVKFHRQFGRLLRPAQFVMPTPAFKIPDTVDKTVDMGLRYHPALEVAKYNIHARKYAYEKSEADYWPTLDLELKAQYLNDVNGDDGHTGQASAMLKLNYLFYDGGVRDGEKGKKYRQLRKEYQRAYTERRNVNQAVRLAWNIYEAEKFKKDFLNDHVDLSAETLSAFKDEYYAGRRTLLDILDMENEYNAAKIANTESEYMNLVAYYRIFQSTGVLIHEFNTSLLEEMHLPSEKPYDLEEYEEDLDPNRDVDIVVDVSDQCDNSIKGSTVLPFGCVEGTLVPIGYQEPEAPGPYILPKEEEKILKIDETKKVQSIHLDIIHFHFDSAELTDEALALLVPIAEQLIEESQYTIEVIGHTDSTGSIEYNQNLSEARAQSVYEELKKAGISEDRLASSGKGELEPVETNETAEGRQKNRRTEFKLTQ